MCFIVAINDKSIVAALVIKGLVAIVTIRYLMSSVRHV